MLCHCQRHHSHSQPFGLVSRAILSALAQSHLLLEIIVVVDGPDPETLAALQSISDPRVKIVALDESVGGAEARNIGVRAAQAEWIALLDDDDEWFPSKIRRQLEVAASSTIKFPIVSCRMFARSPIGEFIWPRRLPDGHEPISEYVLARRGLFQGEGTITTSTLLVPRKLLLEIPFSSMQKRHQEWDWLFKVLNNAHTQLFFAPEPLSIWHIDEARPTVSSRDDWRTLSIGSPAFAPPSLRVPMPPSFAPSSPPWLLAPAIGVPTPSSLRRPSIAAALPR